MKKLNMLTVPLVILAFALAPGGEAQPRPDGGPVQLSSNEAPRPDGGPTRLAADDRGNANSELSRPRGGAQAGFPFSGRS